MAMKKWILSAYDKESASILSQECGISLLTASVLAARGHLSYEDAMRFLTRNDELQSPFALKDMSKAVERIQDAIDSFEKITIYGDYDCDGVTSTAMLYTYLTSVGADVDYYIPAREDEGYGMNNAALDIISKRGGSLVITVDNGINAVDEALYAKSLGLDLVITDHHQAGELIPQAVAVVDPHQKDDSSGFKPLAGVGVAFKLIAALEGGDYQSTLEFFSDIAAIGTIGDIVSLTGENRIIVRHGLSLLSYSENLGINALIKIAGIEKGSITSQQVAFSLVPRINAAGRMGRADLAVSLFLCEAEEEATKIAEELNRLNKERQEAEISVIADIEQKLSQNKSLLNNRVLILKGEGWHPGILGIVCSKLVDRFGKPVILLNKDNEGVLSGSARSIGEFHLFKLLSACSKKLIRFGGHKLAAGLSINETDFDDFCTSVFDYSVQCYGEMPQAILKIDKEISADELTAEELEQFSFLEPFGCQNEQPLFLIRKARLNSITPVSENKHLRLSINLGKSSFTAMLFQTSTHSFFYKQGDSIDLVVTAQLDEYNGKRSVSLKIKDIRPTGFPQDKYFAAADCAFKLLANEAVSKSMLYSAIPTRDEIAVIYKFLKQNNGFINDTYLLYLCLSASKINFCKLILSLNILDEAGLISFSPATKQISLCEITQKVDLNQTPLMKKLCALSEKE